MQASFLCGREALSLSLPDDAILYESSFPSPAAAPAEIVQQALAEPIGSPSLSEALRQRRAGDVVVAVSDITRPIPYAAFLPELLEEIEHAGVNRREIFLLVATGMHRSSTPRERLEMFGPRVVERYRILDHHADAPSDLADLPGRSWSGSPVQVDRRFIEAGFRIITGLVEPHFMAGFSGGRKAVCPGLGSLETVHRLHGYAFMADPRARNGNLENNPLHEEALSVARMAGVDFSLNLALDKKRRVVKAFAGELEKAHLAACGFVRGCACPEVVQEADLVVTSCGGYPLDATYYQCVKGIVSALPAVRPGGVILAFGGCSEGVGSPEYTQTLRTYGNRWQDFLSDIQQPGVFVKDQWQFQMQCRALAKVGRENLLFFTEGLDSERIATLCVNGTAVSPGALQNVLQETLDAKRKQGARIAVFPEGPYCAPLSPVPPDGA